MASRRKNGATIVDIARKLGVSAMTVSRALRGCGEVSEKTRRKVARCAEQLGYRPHRWARSLVTQTASIIGVVIPDISHSYFAEITRGVEEVAGRAGYDLLLCDSWMNAQKEQAAIETLVGSRVDGLILASEHPEAEPAVFVRLKKLGVPFVLVDRFFTGHSFPAVRVDDLAAGRLATEHLIGLGHRRIAHIRGPLISPGTLRHRGYVETLRRHHLTVPLEYVVPGRFDIESGREAMKRLLEIRPRPTAVFAANDPMALGAVYALRDAGLAIPGDMSIVGAGNIEGVHHPNPFLTTIDWPRAELGRAAAALLITSIADPADTAARGETFAPALLIRQSCAPPARSGVAEAHQ